MSIIEKAVGRIASQANEQGGRPVPRSQLQEAASPTPAPHHDAAPLSERLAARHAQAEIDQDDMRENRQAEAAATAATGMRCQMIDLDRLHEAGMVTPNAERTPIAEEFRYIKRPLIARALKRGEGAIQHGNLIMVTSSLPGEGKTFCAINLAMSIAMEMDHTVLLVDADVAHPSVLDCLGLEAETGLMNLLRDEQLDMSDVMIKTNIDTLSILPSGSSQRNATELLASLSMKSLLNEIATRYHDRIVIFDSPPLLPTSEARVLAAQMGQIVMVVEAEKTTQNVVKEALRKIEGCSNINLIYNKGRGFVVPEAYGYYRQ